MESKKTLPMEATTVFLRWLRNRSALAKRCEIAAAKRRDYHAALRFEHEQNALVPVLEKARAELAGKKLRTCQTTIIRRHDKHPDAWLIKAGSEQLWVNGSELPPNAVREPSRTAKRGLT